MIYFGRCASCDKRGWRFGRWGTLYRVEPTEGHGGERVCVRCVSMLIVAKERRRSLLTLRSMQKQAELHFYLANMEIELRTEREKAEWREHAARREATRQDIEVAVHSALTRSKVCPLSR